MRIALTGGIGSGKSTVSRLLAQRGAIVIDADEIAREIVRPGTPALTEIVDRFGAEMLQPDGSLDRGRLAAVVFADSQALADLNAMTHPRIAQRSAELLATAPADALVVYDMPLLVEQGPDALSGWDAIVVVEAPSDQRLARLIDRGMASDDAERRIAAQATDAARRAIATHVLDNSGDSAGLERQVDALWSSLMSTAT